MGPIDLLLDTNVLIKIWRGDAALESAVSNYRAGLETVVTLEFLQGVNKRQKKKGEEFLERFEFVPFNTDVSVRAVQLIKMHAHSKGLRMADALIAATSLETGIPLLTLNTKHFNFIKGIKLI